MKKLFIIIAIFVTVLAGFSVASFAGKKPQQQQTAADVAQTQTPAKVASSNVDPLANEPSAWFFCNQASGVSEMLTAYTHGGIEKARSTAGLLVKSGQCYYNNQVFTGHLTGKETCTPAGDACAIIFPAVADMGDSDIEHKGFVAFIPPQYFQKYYGTDGFKGDALFLISETN